MPFFAWLLWNLGLELFLGLKTKTIKLDLGMNGLIEILFALSLSYYLISGFDKKS